MVDALSRLLVHAASWLVPARERSEWRLEWESELWHYRRELELDHRLDWRMELNLMRRSLGAFADALDLRGPSSPGSDLASDFRFGSRMLKKNAGFTLVAVFLLALGIGATTAIFSLVHSVLLKPLPFRDPDALVLVWEHAYKRERERNVVGPANYLRWRERARSFETMAAFAPWAANLTGEGEPERVPIGYVSANFFTTLGVSAARGRVFAPEDGVPGNDRVALLGDGLWRRRFGGDTAVAGSTIRVDGRDLTVIGVLPPGIELPSTSGSSSAPIQLWVPIAFTQEHREARGRYLLVLARLAPGVLLEQAQEEMKRIASELEKEDADLNAGWSASVFPLQPELVRNVRGAILVLFGAVGAVLLIACANVGNLLLTRAVSRERELSVRAALGAHRFRILRQLAVESLLLAGLGAVFGLLVARVVLGALRSVVPAELPAFISIGLDARVLSFTLLVALLTSFFFGLLPALQVSRLDLIEPLREGARTGASVRRQRLKNALVVLEMALALVLLVATGLLVRSFVTLSRVNPGFEPQGLTSIQVNLSGERYREPAAQSAFYREVLTRLSQIPAVERAGAISWLPLGSQGSATTFRVADKPDPPPEEPRIADVRIVEGELFRAMGIPLVAGRTLDGRDRADSPAVVVVNETLAREVWPGEEAIGKTVLMSWGKEIVAEVIGVVGDVRLTELAAVPRATLYWPQAQLPNPFMTLVVRARGDIRAADLRAVIREVDPEQPLSSMESMEDVVARGLGRPRLTLVLMTVFGAVALLLAAVGIYGVVAFQITQRVHEIGLRMALGASRSDVLKLVLRQGLTLALLGVVVGTAGAVLASRFLESLLYGVAPRDPWTLAAIAAIILAVTLLASYFPARRAAATDPFAALRSE